MFGIGTKSAKLAVAAALAVGVGALGIPSESEAGDRHRHGGHHGHKFKHHGHHRHHAYRHKHYRHGHWHSGFSIRIWEPYRPAPVIRYYPAVRACHPVVGHGLDQFGRRAKFGGTMCYDRFGNGYVVAGSQHVIQHF